MFWGIASDVQDGEGLLRLDLNAADWNMSREDAREIMVQGDKGAQGPAGAQTEKASDLKPAAAGEIPLEEMSPAELIDKIKGLQDEVGKKDDLYLRSQAELENVKKRNQRDKEEWVKFASETIIKELLPVMDHLEMALSHSGNEQSLPALREGVELTLKGLKDALAKSGLEEIQAEGERFDPAFHEAVSQQADESIEAGRVMKVLQKGFTLHRRLVRPAVVVVSGGKPGTDPDQNPTAD